MAHAAFDTLKFVETLTSAGISVPQAKAISHAQNTAFSEAADNTLATKTDIREVKTEIQTVKSELKLEIQEVKTELKLEIQEVRTEIQAVKAELKLEIHQVESKLSNQITHLAGGQKLLYWMLSLVLAGTGAMLIHMFGPMFQTFFVR